MPRLAYTTEEILADHPYARPHEEAGYRLHGGFDTQGRYISPRTLNRVPAIAAWSTALAERGGTLIDSSQGLMVRGPYPNAQQQNFLLDLGLGQTLWNSLTITGVIEARGKRLAQAQAPDFQAIIVEEISETATGHLSKGLLVAHGLDEGGDDALGLGGHDAMWFAARDALFGKGAYPLPEIPESIGRPDIGRLMPQIPKEYEDWIVLLMNVLMIEVRAESFFSFCTNVMRDPRNFRDRREAAMHAAELVDRIRADEASHVGYLTAVISELRHFMLKTTAGGTIDGRDLIDPVWKGMVQWHTRANADNARQQSRDEILKRLVGVGNGDELARQFDALEQKEAA